MINIAPGAILSVITSTGEDCDVTVSYKEQGFGGRGPARAKYTNITTAVATPGTTILAAPESAAYGCEVNGINIRNKGTGANVLTVLVTSTVDGTTTTVEVYEASVGADQELIYESGVGWTLVTHDTLGTWSTYTAPADVANQTADVLANITGLTAPVIVAAVYQFEAVVPFTAGAGTTGLRVTVNGPAMTFVRYKSEYPVSAVLNTMNNLSALQGPAAANADTVSGVAVVQGMFKPSAAGTFAIQFASEDAVAAITALAGSTLRIRRVL